MCEIKENKNKTAVIPRIRMMELLKDALITIEGNQGLSVAEILKYVTSSQEVTSKQILPRLLDTIKVAEDLGLIKKLRNDKYAVIEGATNLCGNCGGKRRRRSSSRSRRSGCRRKSKRRSGGKKKRKWKDSICGSLKLHRRKRSGRSKCRRKKRRSSRRRKSCKRGKRSSRRRRSKRRSRSSCKRKRSRRSKCRGKRRGSRKRRSSRRRKKCTKSCIVRCDEANERQEELQNQDKTAPQLEACS